MSALAERIRVEFANGSSRIPAGSMLDGTIQWSVPPTSGTVSGEITVLWQTEGKGDTDRGIVHFEEVSGVDTNRIALHVKLPLLPLTYQGKLLKIHWLVRVRMKPERGPEAVKDATFTLVAPPE
jgi:hypothetical protein